MDQDSIESATKLTTLALVAASVRCSSHETRSAFFGPAIRNEWMKGSVTPFEMVEPDGPETLSVNVLIQLVRNSRYKFAYDCTLQAWRLERNLKMPGFHWGDYGIVPKTKADDGQGLGVIVLATEPTFVGCFVETRVIGMFQMTNGQESKIRIVGVPIRDDHYRNTRQLEDIEPVVQQSIGDYFAIHDPFDEKELRFEGWGSRDEAWHHIEQSRTRFLREKRDVRDTFEGGGN